ncbi:pre-mRNA-splicing factor SPF27-like [Gigantopelta aegis]|uniref:pre-mRNA-splicing factor SPF27-like n=1 Tax=Gigantopelta aegis TaxID=1735272 RepID=UPI001B887A70|nr:pre-mRNA-splicing factor SPF27-like [Gigantopelta aegis]
MAGEVVVDALPYFDHGYDETGVREAAIALVEEETRRYRPTKNYLDYLSSATYNNFETELMKNEFERLQSRLPMEMMNMKRYELPTPTAGKMTDVSAWMECVENSHAQLEHQALRILNLELMYENGSNAWKMYNSILVQMIDSAQKQLQDLRKKIQEINWQRKNEQTQAGAKLEELEASWVGLVSKNYEIERACAELEKEVMEMEQQRGAR